ncbi:helix-turn-helix domain-containing protein [Pseudorhodobacter wandonensis]|uniref:helix-turn-helix domain-containing protein n=1 Tax=Pseudorhodobacter wandonensis TaxID=1120568 RepID=UPI0009E55071|nr:helix-turn-helix transcriptional regulator [Pseudorhodobacter wandonensis]
MEKRSLTGAELRAARKAAGLTQAAMAARVGVSRDTVQYWEAKPVICRWGAGKRMVEDLGFAGLSRNNARARGWGISWQEQEDARIEAQLAVLRAATNAREAQRLACLRVSCGAKTRKGTPCRNKSESGKRRCKFHGGLSTGPKTQEGRDRIAEAQRLRWARVKEWPFDNGQ